ncbi:MAG: glycosyltransferase [Candidatus Zixiibacteriota bacterium]|nr:MAG: glycosyltransferase [candidate division Zixibacteria bacterium]
MLKSKINLMHAVQELTTGGLERLIFETSRVIDRDSFNVEVCCFDKLGYFADRLNEIGITTTLLQKNQEKFDMRYPYRLAKFLRRKKVHVLQMHSGSYFFGSIAGALANTPVMVYTDHGRFLRDTRHRVITDRISSLFADKIIAVSKELEEYLIRVVKLPQKKIITVINGINTDEFRPGEKNPELLSEFGLDGGFKVVGTVGRLDEVKNQRDLIGAFKIFKQTHPKSVLIIVGDGPLEKQLRHYAGDLGLEKSVFFPGFRSDIPYILNLFDLFVLPSLSEGTSISLLEAMASGIPPVATDVGGNPSIIDHMTDGIIVRPEDVDGLARAMVDLINDSDTYNKISQDARSKVERDYSIKRMVDSYTEIYMELLGKKRKFKYLANV